MRSRDAVKVDAADNTRTRFPDGVFRGNESVGKRYTPSVRDSVAANIGSNVRGAGVGPAWVFGRVSTARNGDEH